MNEEPKETVTTVKTKESQHEGLGYTSTKQKDPRKVEAGRRLGKMSRELKERKIRAKMEEEEKKKSSPLVDYKILMGLAGLLLTAVSIYYMRSESTTLVNSPGTCSCQSDNPEPEPKTVLITHNSKLDRL